METVKDKETGCKTEKREKDRERKREKYVDREKVLNEDDWAKS